MKHNVFDNEDTRDDVLSHSDRMDILDGEEQERGQPAHRYADLC